MLKPKGLGQDTLIGLSCGDVRASPVTPPGVLNCISDTLTGNHRRCRRFAYGSWPEIPAVMCQL